MGIEINNTPGLGVHDSGDTKRTQNETKTQGPAQPAQTPAAVQTDSVKLTQSGKQLSELANRIDKIPTVDTNRVEAIKNAIANGEYEIDAESIAKKLTNLESLLP